MVTRQVSHAQPNIVSREEWIAARRVVLEREKRLTKEKDEISRMIRDLPWVKVEKNYVFDTPQGKRTLADLFENNSQLVIYHFMFGPGWQEGCVGCSFLSDHIDGPRKHLIHHDVSFVVVSRAPLAELESFKRRMGWQFPWASSNGSDFNFDFGVSFTKEQLTKGKVMHNFEMTDVGGMEELSGTSVFVKDEHGDIYHTYSTYGRGGEVQLTAYAYLDMTPKGRREDGPNHNLTDWVRHHDTYGRGGYVDQTGRYRAEDSSCKCCEGKK